MLSYYVDCELMILLVISENISIEQGELATAFGELLRKLWSAGRTSIAPRPFKTKLSRFAPQFSGYNQHDSQVAPNVSPKHFL